MTESLDNRSDEAPTPGSSRRSPRRRRFRWLVPVWGFAICALVAAVGIAGIMLWALHDIPIERAALLRSQPSVLLESADGEPLARVGELRLGEVEREDLPDHLVAAVLTIEDRDFYRHWGIDPRGMTRALMRNLRAGRIVEGGSTITQQLVKLALVGSERTFARKLREAFVAIWLENHLDKDTILTAYLNSIYLGGGAYGVPAAARLYFDRDVSELTLAQAALLAGLIRAPSSYSPATAPEHARARAETVLDAMVATGSIGPDDAEQARAELANLKQGATQPGATTWFADWIAQAALDLAGGSAGSIRVRTTLEPELQALAEETVGRILDGEGADRDVSQAALVAMRPDGAVVAMVGGRSYSESQFNRAVAGKRQPGSSFKPFVYLAALRNGWTPDDLIEDQPLDINGWQPANFSNSYAGRISLADAFAQSLNTPAVRLAVDVGIDEIIATARDLGVESPLVEAPSLALGTSELSLLELTSAFAALRAGEAPIRPWGIAGLGPEDEHGLYPMGAPLTERKSLEPHHRDMLELLQRVVERGTGRAAALGGFAAGKTGTSQSFRDAWFVGFNEHLVVGVWVGNDDDAPMKRVVGGTLPARIWKDFMEAAEPLVAEDASPQLVAFAFHGDVNPVGPDDEAVSDARQPQTDRATNARNRGRNCDVEACARAYRSFRASDCTFQPYSGPRRLCTRGSPPAAAGASPPAQAAGTARRLTVPQGWAGAARQGQRFACNVQACARAYRSFRPSDCTYQPYRGPRRLCQR